jgi:hypothetical protein
VRFLRAPLKWALLGLVLVFVLNSSYINKIPIFAVMKKRNGTVY